MHAPGIISLFIRRLETLPGVLRFQCLVVRPVLFRSHFLVRQHFLEFCFLGQAWQTLGQGRQPGDLGAVRSRGCARGGHIQPMTGRVRTRKRSHACLGQSTHNPVKRNPQLSCSIMHG